MEHTSLAERIFRGALLTVIVVFFLFPIFWIFLMSFQTNEDILRIPPSLFFTPTLSNYGALITGQLTSAAGTLDIAFMKNLWNSVLLSTLAVAIALVLGVPAAYAFASPSLFSPSASRRHCSFSCPSLFTSNNWA
jgi:multiple sugar transport system permease protein